jgi:hypothetical protein
VSLAECGGISCDIGSESMSDASCTYGCVYATEVGSDADAKTERLLDRWGVRWRGEDVVVYDE